MSAPRILIVRTSALGDIVHALPVLAALRRHLPEARIAWLAEEAWAPLLARHPDLDRVVTVRTRQWRRRPFAASTWRGFFEVVGELDAFGPEVVLDLMGNHKAGFFAALTGADRRIGLARADRREPSSALWLSEGVPARGHHAVDQMLSVLDGLGLPAEPAALGGERLPGGDDAGVPDGPFAVILPGAGWHNKRYPEARWGEVARLLAERTGLESHAVYGPGEAGLAEAVAAASGGAARPADAPSLAALTAWLRRARLVLGGDTGPLHLAHALGTGVLCLLGPTDPERSGPYGARDRALWKHLPCSFCYQRLESPKACLVEILPDEVAERAAELLAAA